MTTAKEVVDFTIGLANSGTGVDKDGMYGMQCADLPCYIAKNWFGVDLWGNAIDLLNSALQAGWEVHWMPTEENPKFGAVFVKNSIAYDGKNYGHTGVVIEDSDGYTMKTVEQNIDGNANSLEVGGPARFNTRDFTDVVGWFYPPYNDENKGGSKMEVKNINGEIYSPNITSSRPEIFWSGGRRVLSAIKYIVIHGAASIKPENAWSTWLKSRNNKTSAHYLVTPDEAIGCLGENYIAWHSGGRGVITNENSVGVEHINSSIGDVDDHKTYLFDERTIDRGAKLVAEICKRLGIVPSDKTIVPHRSVSATACPQTLDMADYIRRVQAYYNRNAPAKKEVATSKVATKAGSFKVKVSISDLNIRKSPSLSAGKNGMIKPAVYTITETKSADGYEWGKLKSGAGWIALKYVTKL